MELFRPTGLRELQLVLQRDLAAWPPRLPEQPIFYPVLNFTYAAQIARDWNTKSDDQVGYVTQFEVDDSYASRFEQRIVGGRTHAELWVPAEDLEDFNRHILAPIRVTAAFFGEGFRGVVPSEGTLRGKDAREQLHVVVQRAYQDQQELRADIIANRDVFFLHLPFWEIAESPTVELGNATTRALTMVRDLWKNAFPALPLPEASRPSPDGSH